MKRKITIIAFLSFFIDQAIKLLAELYLVIYNVIPGILSLMYVKNYGVAFSMLWKSRCIIIFISILLILFLFRMIDKDYIKLNKENKLINFSFGILLGGIFGNLFDRIVRGYVIDYISVSLFGYSFPIFNLADVFITFGVVIIIFYLFRKDDEKEI